MAVDALTHAKRPPNNDGLRLESVDTCLFDLKCDPKQMNPNREPARIGPLYAQMTCELKTRDTPQAICRRRELQLDKEEVIRGRKP